MATTAEFIEYACGQLLSVGEVRYKKMFGEYMIYMNEKPILLVCDNTVYVKKLDDIADRMTDAGTGIPYKGAKEHYILDIEDTQFSQEVARELERITPLPKRKK